MTLGVSWRRVGCLAAGWFCGVGGGRRVWGQITRTLDGHTGPASTLREHCPWLALACGLSAPLSAARLDGCTGRCAAPCGSGVTVCWAVVSQRVGPSPRQRDGSCRAGACSTPSARLQVAWPLGCHRLAMQPDGVCVETHWKQSYFTNAVVNFPHAKATNLLKPC
jgi:hypothetical protein